MRDLDPHLIHGSLNPPESTPQTSSRSVQPFYRAQDCDRPTDRPTDYATPSETRMWANAQRDGRPAEHRWRFLFNAAPQSSADAHYYTVSQKRVPP